MNEKDRLLIQAKSRAVRPGSIITRISDVDVNEIKKSIGKVRPMMEDVSRVRPMEVPKDTDPGFYNPAIGEVELEKSDKDPFK